MRTRSPRPVRRLIAACWAQGDPSVWECVRSFERDPASGRLTDSGHAVAVAGATFVATHPSLPVVYAATDSAGGLTTTIRVGPAGELVVAGVTGSGGAGPAHVAVDSGGRILVSANYVGRSVGLGVIDVEGTLREQEVRVFEGSGPVADRQEGAHPHAAAFSDDGRLIFVSDLGADRLVVFSRTDGAIVPAGVLSLNPGAGPRHVVVGAGGFVFVTNELDGTVTSARFDRRTLRFESVQTVPSSSTPDDPRGVAPSELALSCDGRKLYVANRGPGTLSVFAVDGDGIHWRDEVSVAGRTPRHFVVVDRDVYVANHGSGDISWLRCDDAGIPRFVETSAVAPGVAALAKM